MPKLMLHISMWLSGHVGMLRVPVRSRVRPRRRTNGVSRRTSHVRSTNVRGHRMTARRHTRVLLWHARRSIRMLRWLTSGSHMIRHRALPCCRRMSRRWTVNVLLVVRAVWRVRRSRALGRRPHGAGSLRRRHWATLW